MELIVICIVVLFFFKQKVAYEMRISGWSSDVCSSDLLPGHRPGSRNWAAPATHGRRHRRRKSCWSAAACDPHIDRRARKCRAAIPHGTIRTRRRRAHRCSRPSAFRSEEHTSELQSLMRISYAVFCLKKKNTKKQTHNTYTTHMTSSNIYQTDNTLYQRC